MPFTSKSWADTLTVTIPMSKVINNVFKVKCFIYYQFCPLRSPNRDGLVIRFSVWHRYEKSGATVPVTRPAIRGLRIAHHCRTSNAEAHAECNIKTLNPNWAWASCTPS